MTSALLMYAVPPAIDASCIDNQPFCAETVAVPVRVTAVVDVVCTAAQIVPKQPDIVVTYPPLLYTVAMKYSIKFVFGGIDEASTYVWSRIAVEVYEHHVFIQAFAKNTGYR